MTFLQQPWHREGSEPVPCPGSRRGDCRNDNDSCVNTNLIINNSKRISSSNKIYTLSTPQIVPPSPPPPLPNHKFPYSIFWHESEGGGAGRRLFMAWALNYFTVNAPGNFFLLLLFHPGVERSLLSGLEWNAFFLTCINYATGPTRFTINGFVGRDKIKYYYQR